MAGFVDSDDRIDALTPRCCFCGTALLSVHGPFRRKIAVSFGVHLLALMWFCSAQHASLRKHMTHHLQRQSNFAARLFLKSLV
jgi:hypothetical protein